MAGVQSFTKSGRVWLACDTDPNPQGGFYAAHYKNATGRYVIRLFPPIAPDNYWTVSDGNGNLHEFAQESEAFFLADRWADISAPSNRVEGDVRH